MITVDDGNILNAMSNSDINFYLTGSRFFGNYASNSDWDFFTDNTDAAIEWLSAYQFVPEYKSRYSDISIDKVWKLNNIHVQVVKDAVKKATAQRIIKDAFGNIFPRDKELAKCIWQSVLNAFEL